MRNCRADVRPTKRCAAHNLCTDAECAKTGVVAQEGEEVEEGVKITTKWETHAVHVGFYGWIWWWYIAFSARRNEPPTHLPIGWKHRAK